MVGRNAVQAVAPGADAEVTKIGPRLGPRADQQADHGRQERKAVQAALAKAYGVPVEQVSTTFIGPSWGADISKKALEGLIVFLILVSAGPGGVLPDLDHGSWPASSPCCTTC